MKSIIAFLKDESGQTTIEYVLLLVVAAILVVRFKSQAEEGIKSLTGGVFGKAQGFLDDLQ